MWCAMSSTDGVIEVYVRCVRCDNVVFSYYAESGNFSTVEGVTCCGLNFKIRADVYAPELTLEDMRNG
jgi:hypothetical protein